MVSAIKLNKRLKMGLHKSIDEAEVAVFHIQSLWIKAKDQQQSKHKK